MERLLLIALPAAMAEDAAPIVRNLISFPLAV